MNIFVTGITGFVGSHLAEFLVKRPDVTMVYGLKRWRSPLDNIAGIINHPKLRLVDGDLRDSRSMNELMRMIKPELIFHLAAQSYVQTSFEAPIDTLETNIIGTVNLLEAVRQAKIDPRIHICSSSEVYGQVNPSEVPITENNPLRPMSPYAVSKVTEDLVSFQYYHSWKVKTIRTRAFTHTGPRRGSVFVESSFAKQIAEIENGVRKDNLIKVGNLDSIRTFLDVRDIVEAYWMVLTKGTPGEVYNIGGNETMTIREMLDRLLSMTTVKVRIEVDPKLLRPSDVTRQIPSIDKITKEIGWKPKTPFNTTLRDLLDYWRERTKEN